jgi:alpha-ketoglutarate-dependent taurine dioxygenase
MPLSDTGTKPARNRRVVVAPSAGELFTEELPAGRTLPLILHASRGDVDLVAIGSLCRDELRSRLLKHGAILFRGFRMDSYPRFAAFVRGVSGELLQYSERTSPRTLVEGAIYTSTDHPPDQKIPMHCENSYRHRWPMKIFFFCENAAESGGETPVADVRQVLQRIPDDTRSRFETAGVMYVRNFSERVGLSWQTAFNTESREQVEAYCREARIEFTWIGSDRLRTRQVRPAILRHPETGEPSWFNHAAFFHVSGLDPEVRQTLLRGFGEENLPYNTYYGDGSTITDENSARVRKAYDECTIALPWHTGDIMMLDNMLAAHGRMPFTGPRRVLVGMSEISA